MNTASTQFYQRMANYMKASGGGFAILTRPESGDFSRNEQAANAWFYYLARVDLREVAAAWRGILKGLGKSVTAPCERPGLFDLAYEPPQSAPSWRGASDSRDYSDEHRAIMLQRMRDLRAELSRSRDSYANEGVARLRGDLWLASHFRFDKPEAERRAEREMAERWLAEKGDSLKSVPLPKLSKTVLNSLVFDPDKMEF